MVIDTLADLVRINSINPAFSGGTTSEAEIAAHVARLCAAAGLEVTTVEPEPGRTSVIARLRGSGGGRSMMLYAHMDTVGPGGMPDPFDPVVREGRMYGRGTYDMKCGLAACIDAVQHLAGASRLRGDVVLAAVADEENASIGMAAVLEHVRTDAAIVTEPTNLELCIAHKGFAWIEVVVEGRAAHGSDFAAGIDANMRMGRVLARLERLEHELRARAAHPLAGPPSLHAAMLSGGSGPSIYAAEARLQIERRMLPDETEASVRAEIEQILAELRAEDPTFRASARTLLARNGYETAPDSELVGMVSTHAQGVTGRTPRIMGSAAWLDAALIGAAGIEAVIYGPAGEGAHSDVEWVDLQSVEQCAEVLRRIVTEYCA